jgi:hypothetical protein
MMNQMNPMNPFSGCQKKICFARRNIANLIPTGQKQLHLVHRFINFIKKVINILNTYQLSYKNNEPMYPDEHRGAYAFFMPWVKKGYLRRKKEGGSPTRPYTEVHRYIKFINKVINIRRGNIMKNQAMIRKIKVIWVDLKTGESAGERRIVLVLAAILVAALVGVVMFWR